MQKNKICSVCSNEIDKKYCSNCGQYFKNKRVSSLTILGDLFSSVFSLEKSFFKNMKIGLLHPSKIVINYWSGFRGFYYSPGRFFMVAALFILLHYLFSYDFFGISVTSDGDKSNQFLLLLFNIILLTLVSFISYFKYKKNFYEHLILNIYNVSFWTILFVPISILLSSFMLDNSTESFFYIPYHLLISIWNSRAFEMSKLKRFGYVSLNLILFYGTIILLIYFFGEF